MDSVPLLLSIAGPAGYSHLPGTMLPRGFFLALGLFFLTALAVDRGAARLRLPVGASILLLSLGFQEPLLAVLHAGARHAETADRVSLALLIFYAGLSTELRRIRGMVAAGLRLGGLALLLQVALTAWLLQGLLHLLPSGGLAGLAGGLPVAVVWLTATCLMAQDTGSLDDQLQALQHRLPERLAPLPEVATAVSILGSLLLFGFLVGTVQLHSHSDHLAFHTAIAGLLPRQLTNVLHHVLAGILAGVVVGAVAPRLVDGLVRSDQHLLLVVIALAFVAFGLGQMLGGGGLMAVFCAGVWLSNGRYRLRRFDQRALHHVMHPFNTAAEYSVLLLLGLSVQRAALLAVLPLGVLLALLLPLVRWFGVRLALPGRGFSSGECWLLASCSLPGAVSLGLALALEPELIHLPGVSPEQAEVLGGALLALIFVVVVANLLMQRLLALRLLARRTDQPAEQASRS